MPKRKFTEEDLKLIAFEDKEGFSTVQDEITGTGRWDVHHTMIFKEDATGKLYQLIYSRGATEIQDDGPQFFGTDLPEVEAYEKTVTDYREVK